jgi:hypothetical protein
MTAVDPYWAEVKTRERVYANAGTDEQKMGYVNPGNVIHVIEHYGQSWKRFDNYQPGTGADEVKPWDANYKEWWTQAEVSIVDEPDPGPGPDPEPEPEPPPGGAISFGEAGQALDTLVRFLRQAWNR